MNEKERFSENLKRALIANGYEPKAVILEREFNLRYYGKGLSLHGVAKWLRGEAIPSLDKLRALSTWLKVDLTELVYDSTLRKLEENEKRKTPAKYYWESAASFQEQAVFEVYLSLPPAQRKIVREVIIAFHKARIK
ncbi:hypothetical protein A1D23_06845 [Chelonobacter oris]|uniref:HTH cro/C1-type domain-containing protein n=1 Tax=Chelonobacter oris TaxID=505317 RepID=A0A0A3AQB5_9PAST|nr:hypothetical protein [Chelonobacter oris]KGQ71546.1 hypothetical protein OA57_00295 [Chelonobacter oris]MDH2999810.1 hypothetical protein [Chelonobacter oris]